ncbi:hypothetical protein ACJX0J_013756, partial [Zea mays]
GKSGWTKWGRMSEERPVPRRESPWGLPEGDTRQPKAHRCNDRAEDVVQACFEGNPFKTVPGPFKLFWQCMRSKPGEEPTEPYTYLQLDPPRRVEVNLEQTGRITSSSTMGLSSSISVQKTLYEVLSVSEDATYDEIRAAYSVQKAWEILRHPTSRADYDKQLQSSRQNIEIIASEVQVGDMIIESTADADTVELSYPCRVHVLCTSVLDDLTAVENLRVRPRLTTLGIGLR